MCICRTGMLADNSHHHNKLLAAEQHTKGGLQRDQLTGEGRGREGEGAKGREGKGGGRKGGKGRGGKGVKGRG